MGPVARLIYENKRVTEYDQRLETDFLGSIGLDVNIIWGIAIRPLLFGSIGAAFDLSVMPKESLLKSCAVIVIGLCFRLPTAFMASLGANLSAKERLFVSVAWVPKATVQAGLCTIPLIMIQRIHSESPNFNELADFGIKIMSTGILSIIITAPIGLLLISFLGPRLLTKFQSDELGQQGQSTPVVI